MEEENIEEIIESIEAPTNASDIIIEEEIFDELMSDDP